MEERSANPGPYSKNTMWALGLATGFFGVLVLVWGAITAADGGDNGVELMVIGAGCALIAAVGIPFAIRRGRM
ncbi:hypothetical protein ACQPWW_19570 [Micromonospora sp. CA-240977]|uniref:hypothetical protein n=1 Tax=Micromonospora sp. CA-240977 TaxID=3239957 RepID=UPI003D8A5F5C